MTRDVREPLRRVLAWIRAHGDPRTGALVCGEHRIEHTGKSACAVILAIELARDAEAEERADLVRFAREQCERIASRLEREGDSTCFTFRPGRHDPYNCSNSVIDGGACSDALASACLELADDLTVDERDRFGRAAVLHAQTYLRYAIIDKGIPAQCAWAMTGAARAFRLSGHEVLRLAVTEGARRIRGQQRGDGTIPYHAEGAEHPGATDASAFYHSRVFGFTAFALDEVLGPEAGAREDAAFGPGLAALHALSGPDGIKLGAVEAKPWYWGGPYEVASNPFDVAAFGLEYRRTGSRRALGAMAAAWRAWLAHLTPEGEPTSFRGPGRRSYQCSFFWAAHACWAARVLPELREAVEADPRPGNVEPGVRHLEDVDLVRIDAPRVVAWIRGARPPGNAMHGSPLGGLLRVFSRETRRDLFLAPRFERRPEAHWSGLAGAPSPVRGLRAGGHDVRFAAWLTRNRLRNRLPLEAARQVPRAIRRSVFDYASASVSTAHDRNSRLRVDGEGAAATVQLESVLAHRASDGGRFGATLARFATTPEGGLHVEESCGDAGRVRGLWFRIPERAVVLEETTRRLRYRLD